jgi:hypothetical protein
MAEGAAEHAEGMEAAEWVRLSWHMTLLANCNRGKGQAAAKMGDFNLLEKVRAEKKARTAVKPDLTELRQMCDDFKQKG